MGLDQKNTTIQDVARIAGVSTATVSRVLSKRGKVSAKSKERVEAAIVKTGYIPNIAAQSLRRRSGKTILIALPNMGNPFFAPIIDAVERVCVQRGYDILMTNRRPAIESVPSLMSFFTSNRADGLLLLDGSATSSDWQEQRGERTLAFPTVNVCEEILGSELPLVVSDNEGGVNLAITHLAKNGHKNIGRIHGPKQNVLFAQRGHGFDKAMRGNGLDPENHWLCGHDFDFESGRIAAREFAELEVKPTAVFCDSDEIAIGFIAGLRDHGLSCPHDVSVVGFDDIALSSYCAPALTTIKQQHSDLGTISAELLIDMLEFPTHKHKDRIHLSCNLVERESVRDIS